VSRHIGLSGVSDELAAMDGPTPPGTAVVTEFRA
jgi:alcohol dehydrogenase